ncbi:MAG TPA: hypothetical protein VKG62_00775 [Solirubrobacteraceae bacterium]|nr:hypothetical protein [Solirubrobacteraceae bacterium]
MGLLSVVLSLPLALDGESSGAGNSTGIAVISIVSIVSGYLLLAGLWYFVFRDKARSGEKARSRRKRGSPED